MEDIFQILIFVAFAVLSFIPQLIKGKKEPKVPSGTSQEMLEEVFPEINEGKEIWMKESLEKTIIRENKPLKKERVQTVLKESSHASQPSSSPMKDKKIRINNREEAKRAFIYSEIFNRKY